MRSRSAGTSQVQVAALRVGVEGEVDLRDFVMNDQRPIVAALRVPEVFAAIRVVHDTVVWGNGFDLAPEYLRANLRTRASA